MKRLLIPLLAALALPTAVSAEIINLECVKNWSQGVGDKQIFKNQAPVYFDIDTVKHSTTIDDGYNLKKFNTFIARDTFILSFINTGEYPREEKYEISRLDGTYLRTDTSLYLEPNSPFFNQEQFDLVMSAPDRFAALIKPYKAGGTCKKAKKVNTMF